MAGRRVCSNKAVAVAMVVVALLALLFAASEAKQIICRVDRDSVLTNCGRSCSSGRPSKECCDALKDADFHCLCTNYWDKLKDIPTYARCAQAIPSTCNLRNAKCH